MTTLLRKPTGTNGKVHDITPANAGWGFVGFGLYREFYVPGRSTKEIARELHVSRNTVRKIRRSGATAFEYERSVQPQPKLGQWRDDLDRLLAANAGRSSRDHAASN